MDMVFVNFIGEPLRKYQSRYYRDDIADAMISAGIVRRWKISKGNPAVAGFPINQKNLAKSSGIQFFALRMSELTFILATASLVLITSLAMKRKFTIAAA